MKDRVIHTGKRKMNHRLKAFIILSCSLFALISPIVIFSLSTNSEKSALKAINDIDIDDDKIEPIQLLLGDSDNN